MKCAPPANPLAVKGAAMCHRLPVRCIRRGFLAAQVCIQRFDRQQGRSGTAEHTAQNTGQDSQEDALVNAAEPIAVACLLEHGGACR
jgi:hypothetical protein